MHISPGLLEAIQEGVESRKDILVCPLCHSKEWELPAGVVLFPVQPNPKIFDLSGEKIPCAGVICVVCGNTIFLNLLKLGLSQELFES